MKKRHDTPKSHTQQRKFKIYPIAMSGVLESGDVSGAPDADGSLVICLERIENG